MSKDLKAPNQQPSEPTRMKQSEDASRQYLDLQTGNICVDGYEPTPRAETEDPNTRIMTKRLSNTSAKPLVIGSVK